MKAVKCSRTTVSSRTEASATVSEFAIESTRDKKLEVDSLLSPCGKSAALTDLRKSIVKANVRVDVVPSPCLKPQYEKVLYILMCYKMTCRFKC